MLNTLISISNLMSIIIPMFMFFYIIYRYWIIFDYQYGNLPILHLVDYTIDIFSLYILFFTIVTSIVCYFIFKRYIIVQNNITSYLFLLIVVSSSFLVYSKNMLVFFFYYESILLLSVMLVWVSSPNKRSKQTSLYFLFWTQLGSFLVFIGISIFYHIYEIYSFSSAEVYYNNSCLSFYILLASLLVFIGFSIKVPLWPFHFWLSKTHVEASTGFSIFLSGILVKTAILGLFKFKFIFLYLNYYVLFVLVAYSILDVSFKLYSQVDFKKLIAYATIQEMGILVMLIAFDSNYTRLIFLYFCFFHTCISGLFFFLNDVLYKRFGSRQFNCISGLVTTHPKLFISIILSTFVFLGLPLTIKFFVEIQIIFKFLHCNLYYGFLFIFLVQYIGILFFFKNIILFLFGPSIKYTSVDLTFTEITYVCLFYIIIITLSLY